jgi:2-methylcitrate dehydratase PrpD
MALGVRFDDLPQSVVTRAKHCLLDTMAVIIGGSGMEGIPAIVEMVKSKGGRAESVIPFYGGVVPAAEAALAIGPMARAMDCGDLHEEAGHVSEYIVSTLLAAMGLRSGPVSGQEFLTALVVGQETLIRIGIAYKLISEGVKRGHSGGHYIFGAVAAVGRLLGLSQEELENAQGIARTMTQPSTMAIYLPVTLMVRVHHGLVGQAAINACLLARAGITGPREQILFGQQGYLSSVPWRTDPHALLRGLGERWETEGIATKGYSACYFSHTSIDGILAQLREYSFDAADIESIYIEVSSAGWKAVCEPKSVRWNPQTAAECQFSLPYVVASAAFDKTVFLQSYEEGAIARRDVRELMARISASEDSALPDWTAKVITRLRDGREFSGRYDHVHGHPAHPFAEEALVAKFNRCIPYAASPIEAVVADSLVKNILNLEHVYDVGDSLLGALSPAAK